jgi:hypothetical protein
MVVPGPRLKAPVSLAKRYLGVRPRMTSMHRRKPTCPIDLDCPDDRCLNLGNLSSGGEEDNRTSGGINELKRVTAKVTVKKIVDLCAARTRYPNAHLGFLTRKRTPAPQLPQRASRPTERETLNHDRAGRGQSRTRWPPSCSCSTSSDQPQEGRACCAAAVTACRRRTSRRRCQHLAGTSSV